MDLLAGKVVEPPKFARLSAGGCEEDVALISREEGGVFAGTCHDEAGRIYRRAS